MIKSALRRFKCLGSLNSAENWKQGWKFFGKFSQKTLQLLARNREVTHKGLEKRLFARARIYTQYTVHFTTFRVPYAVPRYGGAQFWCFLLADLSVGVETAARAPFCPFFLQESTGNQWEGVPS